MPKPTVYNQTLEITRDYLGPAAKRVLDRQIISHLHKDPIDLESNDIEVLIDWAKISFAFLTDDISQVEDYITRLQIINTESKQLR